MTQVRKSDYFVISYEEGEALPYGFAWFDTMGGDPRGGSAFTYYATRAECITRSTSHVHYTNPVLLDDDSPEQEAA